MAVSRSQVVSMRLPAESGIRLQRMARRHGWTASDTSARLVEEGLRRSDFAFIDFRDSAAGRQAYLQSSSLAVWEVILLLRSYNSDQSAVGRHLNWPEAKIAAAAQYAEAYPEEIDAALAENALVDPLTLQRMLPQTTTIQLRNPEKRKRGQASSR